jgi:hypothetical protein
MGVAMEHGTYLPEEAIATRTCLAGRQVHWIRGQKVMLAFDLPGSFGVPTKRLIWTSLRWNGSAWATKAAAMFDASLRA